MKTILVPVDFSAVTRGVVKAARELARSTGAKLLLLHVVQPPVASSPDNIFEPTMADAFAIAEKYGSQRLKRLENDVARDFKRVSSQLETGHPGTVIAACAAKLDPAYLVIGSHGHGAMYDLFVGSTTQAVIKRAGCPVLVIPDGHGAAKSKR